MEPVPFERLGTADLAVDAVYAGGATGSVADDPLSKLLPCGNQGGFRYAGSKTKKELRFAVLYTSGADPDWPDVFDPESGLFTYFGDNRAPGSQLHATPRGGNEILRWTFEHVHDAPPAPEGVPPFFIFSRERTGRGRDVRFVGLAAPGAKDLGASEDLVAIWRTTAERRFQNYRATFTVLDAGTVTRRWIDELLAGDMLGAACPHAYRAWVESGDYRALEAPRTLAHRTREQQLPASPADSALVATLYEHFRDAPHGFEACAIELWKLLARQPVAFVATRRSSDGGRDAYGWYSIGPDADRIRLEWSLEAKLYAPTTSAGVKDVARLISRLRHREFGVFVTTSYVGRQAYEELRGDGHPVVVVCGRDIAEILKGSGHGTVDAVQAWLRDRFPHA